MPNMDLNIGDGDVPFVLMPGVILTWHLPFLSLLSSKAVNHIFL